MKSMTQGMISATQDGHLVLVILHKWSGSNQLNLEWVMQRSTVESRRSKRTKADDPQKDESRRSGAKADDLWVKADDPGRKQTILGLKQTIFWAKADDLWVKADDPGQSGRSEGLKADDPMSQSGRSYLKYGRSFLK